MDLFTEENTDIVDYFEVTCERSPDVTVARAAGVKTMKGRGRSYPITGSRYGSDQE